MDPSVLQVVRLKGGMADAATVARLCERDEAEVTGELESLAAAGAVQERRGRYRLLPEGRDALRAALEAERAGLDTTALEQVWDDFSACDHELKQVLQDWQLRDGAPNDHSDAAYDAAVVARVAALHHRVSPLSTRVAAVVPRLSGYPERLDEALTRLQAGETKYLSNPMCDSYHTVFHELHEELYDATGKDRAAEEAAGAGAAAAG